MHISPEISKYFLCTDLRLVVDVVSESPSQLVQQYVFCKVSGVTPTELVLVSDVVVYVDSIGAIRPPKLIRSYTLPWRIEFVPILGLEGEAALLILPYTAESSRFSRVISGSSSEEDSSSPEVLL